MLTTLPLVATAAGVPQTADPPRPAPAMAVTGHFRTLAAQQMALLFDHLVGAQQNRLRHGEAERLGGLQVYDRLEFCRKLNW